MKGSNPSSLGSEIGTAKCVAGRDSRGTGPKGGKGPKGPKAQQIPGRALHRTSRSRKPKKSKTQEVAEMPKDVKHLMQDKA